MNVPDRDKTNFVTGTMVLNNAVSEDRSPGSQVSHSWNRGEKSLQYVPALLHRSSDFGPLCLTIISLSVE